MRKKNQILKICFTNYLLSKKNNYSDTWKVTSQQNIDFFKQFSLKNPFLNSNIKGLAPLDNYPSIDHLTNKNAKILNYFQNNQFFNVYKKIKFKSYIFSASYVVAFRYFNKIKKLINNKSKVLIIGDGLGILSSMILKYFNCKIFLCDLSETLVYQEYNLRNNFKNYKFNFIASEKDKINSTANVNFINADQIHRLNIDLNLVINTDSFCEMDKYSVDKYFKFANKNLKVNGHFFYCNKGGLSKYGHKYPGNYPLSNNFILRDIEVMHPSHRDTFNKYLAVTAKKISKKKLASNKILNFSLKKKIINNFMNNSQKVIYKNDFIKLKDKCIKLFNSLTKSKISNKKKGILKIDYNLNKTNKEEYYYNNFYHNLISCTVKALEKNRTKTLENNYLKILNLNEQILEVTCLVKLASIYRFYNENYSFKITQKIKEDSFEKIFLKFILLENLKKKDDELLIKKLNKFKSDQFFDELKFLYCVLKKNKKQYINQSILRIEKKIKSKLNLIYFLNLLYNSGKISVFKKYLNKYKKIFKISTTEINEILLSTCFINDDKIKNFKVKFKNMNFKENNQLNELILNFKTNKINEKNFIKIILNKYNNYYSLGHILKNTIKNLNKKNVRKICNKSLKHRSVIQNINFIAEIYFYNEMYVDCYITLSKIKNLHEFSVFYDLKRVLSSLNLQKLVTKKTLKENVGKDFFRTVHNGRLAIFPFMCTGNNAVRVTEN